MLYSAVLLLHITVACTTIVTVLLVPYALLYRKEHWYKKISVLVAVLMILETVSGFFLAVLSPDVSVTSVGVHLMLYLGVCLIAEVALVLRMRKVWIG